MSNEVDHKIALSALGWEALIAHREKVKAKLIFKVLNQMWPKSLTNRFNYKKEISNYDLGDIPTAVCLPQP